MNVRNELQRLQLKEILFGKTDAFNEVLQLGPDFFIDSFVENERYQKDDFLNGNKFYIVGKKGTGKTAFLRYLECQLNDPETIIIPIRFKSEFDELDKEQFVSAVDTGLTSEQFDDSSFEIKSIDSLKSYVLMWKTFLVNQMVLFSQKGEYTAFFPDSNYQLMVSLLKALYGEEKNKKIMPKLRKGTIEINGALAACLSANVKVELDFDEKTKKVKYLKLSRKIINLFSELRYGKNPIYLFIDELELSVRNKELYKKDVALVRDLILAIDELNRLCRQRAYEIHLIASIRSEVVTSVLSAGFEINKCIEDFGVTINWFQKGGNYTDNPLLKIIEQKIHASEKRIGFPLSDNVWNIYFDNQIHNTEVRRYILNNIWYRPRDIVRLMLLLQTESYGKSMFDQESFDRAQQEYSNRMWTEFSEELRLTYTSDDLSAIKTFLTKIPLPFTYEELEDRRKKLSAIYPNIKEFFDKVSMAEFLEKMFMLGIIGNTGERMVFSFLGDQEISLLDPMVIHTPLRNFFAVQRAK